MAAAQPTALGRIVAAWAPLALLVAVELVTRVPAQRGALSVLRVVAAGGIAGVAAWVSYWHTVELALAAGESTVTAHLLPISVDGLVAVASVCLVELSRRPAGTDAGPVSSIRYLDAEIVTTTPSGTGTADRSAPRRRPPVAASGRGGGGTGTEAANRATVRRLAAEHPAWTQAQLADAAGVSVRTVRRHLAPTSPVGIEDEALALDLADLAALTTLVDLPIPTTNSNGATR